MKKLFITLSLATTCFVTHAQTNTFPSSGNVGIGTTSPQAALSIKAASVNGMLRLTPLTDNTEASIGFNTHSSETDFSNVWVIGAGGWASGPNLVIGNTSHNGPLMTFLPNGNVLIGQTTQVNASYILDVNGSVRANAVTVNATGADFVFAPSYKLLSLPELSNFIQKNHHLPEIASAKEMQTNGLNVGDNQIKLLQKVEELTLYLIEKDKQLSDERQVNNQQQQEIDDQKSIVGQQSKELKILQEQMDQLKAQLSSLIKQQKN